MSSPRDHLFEECDAWKKEIHILWKKVGDISGEMRQGYSKDRGPGGLSRVGKGYNIRKVKVRPSNISTRPDMECQLFVEVVLDFLKNGTVEEGRTGPCAGIRGAP